jgi:hypothetical protein
VRWFVPVVAVGLMTTACGTAATPTAVSASFTDVFGGLYVGQQKHLGRTEITRASLHASSRCHRTGTTSQGPGEDWLCLVQYDDAGTPAVQSFEVQVKPDGCWKADGPPASQPAQLVDAATGRLSVNQLSQFDGCLDTSWGRP